MHITSTETRPIPPSRHATGHELRYSELQASNGLALYSVEGFLPHVALGEWSCATAGRVVFLTSLNKLGWAGPDRAVYVDRKKRPDKEGEVDFFLIGGTGCVVNDQRNVHLSVIMPEKICLMPPVERNNVLVPSVIYAAQDEDGVASIFNSLQPGAIIHDLKHLEDFWVNRGKLWVMTRGEMTSLSEPVNRKLRIYGQNGGLEKEVDLNCVACGRPVFVKYKLVFPVQRWSNGPWELTTGSECLWSGRGISNLFIYRDEVFCLVSDKQRLWRPMRGKAYSSFSHLGELVGDVCSWNGSLLFHMRDKEKDYVVYDNGPCRDFPEIDNATVRVYNGKPVYAARAARGNGSWNLVHENEIIGKPCDRVLEIDAASKILKACFLRGNQIVVETYKV